MQHEGVVAGIASGPAKTAVAAILDRLIHNAVEFNIRGPSCAHAGTTASKIADTAPTSLPTASADQQPSPPAVDIDRAAPLESVVDGVEDGHHLAGVARHGIVDDRMMLAADIHALGLRLFLRHSSGWRPCSSRPRRVRGGQNSESRPRCEIRW